MARFAVTNAVAHLKKHRPSMPDREIADRATQILRERGVIKNGDCVSRSLVAMVRLGERNQSRSWKTRAVWEAMKVMHLVPAIPEELRDEGALKSTRTAANDAEAWQRKYLELARRVGLEESVKEVPVLTPPMLRYYGFRQNPVYDEIRAVEDIWWGEQHKEAKSVLHEAVREGRFVRLSGRRGAGKSIVGYLVRRELAKQDDVVIVDPGSVITGVIREMDVVTAVIQALQRRIHGRDEVYPEAQSRAKRVQAMRYFLAQARRSNWRVVVWIDEAHQLRAETFLALKRFLDEVDANFRRLLAVVLIGQNLEVSPRSRVADLSEVTLRLQTYTIAPMNAEMPDYLRFKIRRTGADVKDVVTPKALAAIAERAPYPLDANAIFAQALIDVYREKDKPIRQEHIDGVPDDPESLDEAVAR